MNQEKTMEEKSWEERFEDTFCYKEKVTGEWKLSGIISFADNYKDFIREELEKARRQEREKMEKSISHLAYREVCNDYDDGYTAAVEDVLSLLQEPEDTKIKE